jgi:hypothetical protein
MVPLIDPWERLSVGRPFHGYAGFQPRDSRRKRLANDLVRRWILIVRKLKNHPCPDSQNQ